MSHWRIWLVYLLHHVLIVVIGVRRGPVRKTRSLEIQPAPARNATVCPSIIPADSAAGRSSTHATLAPSGPALRCDENVDNADRLRLGQLGDLLVEVDIDGWDSSAGRAVLRLIRRECVAESFRWINRAGHLGEVGVAPVWTALAE